MSNATNFGQCWSCVSDLTMPSVMASGNLVVAQAIARRWQTPRGGLVGDSDYGYCLSDFVSSDISDSDLVAISGYAASEALKDQRVTSCDATATLNLGTLTVTAKVTTGLGPFTLVVSTSQFLSTFTVK